MLITKVDVKPGAYWEASWGYDQTNIDYLVVVKVSPTGKTAICRMASAIHLGDSGTSDVLTPGTPEGPEFRMRIDNKATYTVLIGSYPFIWGHWDSKRLGRFYSTRVGDIAYQTKPEFGH